MNSESSGQVRESFCQLPGGRFRAARTYPARMHLLLSPPLAYSFGLVAQILTDASPTGLTLESLGGQSKLAVTTLDEVLRFGLKRRFVRCDGELYFAATHAREAARPARRRSA